MFSIFVWTSDKYTYGHSLANEVASTSVHNSINQITTKWKENKLHLIKLRKRISSKNCRMKSFIHAVKCVDYATFNEILFFISALGKFKVFVQFVIITKKGKSQG